MSARPGGENLAGLTFAAHVAVNVRRVREGRAGGPLRGARQGGGPLGELLWRE